MTAPIQEPTEPRQVAQIRFVGKDTRQKPLASKWIQVLDTGDCGTGEFEWQPCFQNGYAQVTDPLELFNFRIHYDGSLEFKGHIDVSGAASGDVAFTLPGLFGEEPDYTLPKSRYFPIALTDDGGTSFIIGLVFIDSTNADVTLIWPAS